MEADSVKRLIKLIGCAAAVFAAPPALLMQVMLGCLSIPHHDG